MHADLPPCTEMQIELCAEFRAWRARQGLPEVPGDDPMLLNMLSRHQRAWLWNFIARWDWASEGAARLPGALVTSLELAGTFMQVVREHCSRGEFQDVLRGDRAVSQVLHVGSVIDLAFSRAHRVPAGGARSLEQQAAEDALKAEALQIVSGRYQRVHAKV